jgi:hypothetical protein
MLMLTFLDLRRVVGNGTSHTEARDILALTVPVVIVGTKLRMRPSTKSMYNQVHVFSVLDRVCQYNEEGPSSAILSGYGFDQPCKERSSINNSHILLVHCELPG